jgi:hypothetical protein
VPDRSLADTKVETRKIWFRIDGHRHPDGAPNGSCDRFVIAQHDRIAPQVSWGPTYWDYTGGTVPLKIFSMDSAQGNGVWNTTQLALETATVGGEPDGITFSFGTPGANAQWLTVTLSTPVTLAPNKQYGFMLASDGTGGNDSFFMEIDGTSPAVMRVASPSPPETSTGSSSGTATMVGPATARS